MERLISFCGLFILLGFCFLCSKDRKSINWRTVGSGVLLQFCLGFLILKTPFGASFFEGARELVQGVLNYTNEGARFIFGDLVDPTKFGFLFFTMVLPTIIFTSSLMSILYHLGVMQFVIKLVAKVMVIVMGTSGAESLAAAANIFAGQTEAPLVVKPFINSMTRSELLSLMTGGMATVAGGVLAAYVGMGIDAGHLLAASVMSAPAALVCAKIFIPEKEKPITQGEVKLENPEKYTNLIEAASTGAADGLKLSLNVAAMLLAFIALIALLNGVLSYIGSFMGFESLSLELITGYLFAPISWILGVPWQDSVMVGSLLGKKVILNEFVAYLDLKEMMSELQPRSIVIATYALCGFANFSSIAIQLGGVGTIAPKRSSELAELGIPSLIAGTVACLMTACIAGIFI